MCLKLKSAFYFCPLILTAIAETTRLTLLSVVTADGRIKQSSQSHFSWTQYPIVAQLGQTYQQRCSLQTIKTLLFLFCWKDSFLMQTKHQNINNPSFLKRNIIILWSVASQNNAVYMYISFWQTISCANIIVLWYAH